MRSRGFAILLSASILGLANMAGPVDAAESYALVGGTVHPVSSEPIENGTVLVRDGRIEAVGSDLQVPADAETFDISGHHVYPGLFDAASILGLSEIGAISATNDTTEWGDYNPHLVAATAIHPASEHLPVARANGITHTLSIPGGRRASGFPGRGSLVHLAGWTVEEMAIEPIAAMPLVWPGRQTRSFDFSTFSFRERPWREVNEEYEEAVGEIRGWLDAARHYSKAREADPAGVPRDLALEALGEVLERELPVMIAANSARDIRAAIDFAEEYDLWLVISGGSDAQEVKDLLAEKKIPVILGATQRLPGEEDDPYDAAYTNAAQLHAAGVKIAFGTFGASNSRTLPYEAGHAAAFGLPREVAIEAITLAPAEILRVDDRLGSLEPGKIANLIVTDGDPLEITTQIRHVFVDGLPVGTENKHRRLYEQYRARPLPSAEGTGGETAAASVAEADTAAESADAEASEAVGTEADDTGRTLAIRGATVITMAPGAGSDGGTIENGTVLVRDGKIAAVGTDVEIPEGAEVVDAKGQYLIPGIIDAHSHIAGDGGLNEGSVPVSSMADIGSVLDPDDINIYRDAAGGVTTANILHGSANPIGGTNQVIKLRWGADADGLRFEGAPPGIKFALGENPKRSRSTPRPGTPRTHPNTRMGVMDVIRQAFLDASEYRDEWQAWRSAGEQGTPPRRDLMLEPLVEILEGERLVHAHCYRADEILQLLRLAEDFGFRIATFQHVLEGYKVADEIAAHGAGASTFSDWWAFKVEAYEAIPYNAALMTDRGVLVSINSDSAEEARHLNQEAAKTMKWGGLDARSALALVTINPAIQLGIEDRVGSIEVGKDADLVIYEGHPLSIYAKVRTTYIDGEPIFDVNADMAGQASLKKEKDALLAKADAKKGDDEDKADKGKRKGKKRRKPRQNAESR